MIEKIKKRWNSDTYRVAMAGAIITIIEANSGLITSLVPLSWRPYMPLVFPAAMMVMREFTTTALSEK